MKYIITATLFLLIALTNSYSQSTDLSTYLRNLPKQELSQVEIDGLILMREEEKLARDVYVTLYNKWSTKVFDNIKSSEQTHMDWVGVLLEKYELADPMLSEIGVFTSTHLQGLYTQLVTAGNESSAKALFIGCTIEDLDIKDLEDLISISDNIDVLIVYQNLMLGSRNHLRSFNRLYSNQGETYTEQFISHEELISIIGGQTESGPVDENGNPLDITNVEVDESSNQKHFQINISNDINELRVIGQEINANNISIVIYDMNGNSLMNKTENINNGFCDFELDLSGFISGVYIYSIKINELNVESGKINLIK